MHGPPRDAAFGRLRRREGIIVLGATFLLAGCVSEAAGSQVWGVNQWDRDVIVASTLHGGSYVLPARTFGKLFDAYRDPAHDILVYDRDCGLLATLPLTVALETVRITPTGEPQLTGDDPGTIPTGLEPAPIGPGGGDAFEPKDCS